MGAVGFTSRTRVTVGRQRVREAIRFLAADSYSLDSVHCTVVYAFRQLGPGDPRAWVMAALGGNGVVLAAAVASERRHRSLARWQKRHVGAAGA